MDGSSITYATPKDWVDIMKNRSKVRMHELIERLGLRAKWSSNKRGKTNFESALVRELVADMGDVVTTLPKEPEELMKFLGEVQNLKDKVGGLIEKHGSKIWGRVGDREHLINANEPGVEDGVYPKDLYIENEEDKEMINKLLHWWIGLKACNVILARDRLDRERRKKAENRQARAEAEFAGQSEGGAPASFVALAPNSVLHEADIGQRGSPMSSTAMLTPPESGESPVVGPREGHGFMVAHDKEHPTNGNAAFSLPGSHQAQPGQQPQNIAEGVWNRLAAEERASRESSATLTPSNGHPTHLPESKAAVEQQIVDSNQVSYDRQISVDVARLVGSFQSDNAASEEMPQPSSSKPYPCLDYEVLLALRQYIYGEKHSITFEESMMLDGLEKTWRVNVRGDYHKMLDNLPMFIARERAFLTWIELKRHLAALERANQRWEKEGHSAPEIELRIQQHRSLMGCTETIVSNFEDIGKGFGYGSSVTVDRDELLRQAFVVIAGQKYAVEMQWKTVEFSGLVAWLSDHLADFRRDEEEEGRGTLWSVG